MYPIQVILFSLCVLFLGSAGASTAHAQSAQSDALEALRLEFDRDNMGASDEELDSLFRKACEGGYNAACKRSSWRSEGRPDLEKARGVFNGPCQAGDQVACLVVGWALDAKAASTVNDEERNRYYRTAASMLKGLCESGRFGPACHDFGFYLFENKGFSPSDDLTPLAIKAWDRGCDLAENASCTQIATLKRDGDRVRQNRGHAVQYARLACNRSYAPGCFVLGRLQDADWNATQFDQFYDQLCQQGHRESCHYLAQAYHYGRSPEPAQGRTQGLYKRGCEIKHARSCFEAGAWEMEIGGSTDDAAELFQMACHLGEAAGCSSLVELIIADQVNRDIGSAIYAYERACEQREPVAACTELAYELLRKGSPNYDASRACGLLMLVATGPGTDPKANVTLGGLFKDGVGCDKDRTEAAQYLLWACDGGIQEACIERGLLLIPDIGVRRDHPEALRMFSMACEKGQLAEGCFQAGRLLETSEFIKDPTQAMSWYERGCEGGVKLSCSGWGRTLASAAGGNSYEQARTAFERALPETEAKRPLAEMLFFGCGGGKKKKRARDLCRQACVEGDRIACKGPEFSTGTCR